MERNKNKSGLVFDLKDVLQSCIVKNNFGYENGTKYDHILS